MLRSSRNFGMHSRGSPLRDLHYIFHNRFSKISILYLFQFDYFNISYFKRAPKGEAANISKGFLILLIGVAGPILKGFSISPMRAAAPLSKGFLILFIGTAALILKGF